MKKTVFSSHLRIGIFLVLFAFSIIGAFANVVTVPLSFENAIQYTQQFFVTTGWWSTTMPLMQVNKNNDQQIYFHTGVDHQTGASMLWLTAIGQVVQTVEVDPTFSTRDKSSGISITESQISDLQTYLTSESDTLQSVTDRGNTTTNDIIANGFFYSSDRKLKTNISPLTDNLNKILKLSGVSFDWKKTRNKDIGLIAQEVEKIYPELVSTDANDYKAVKYGNLVAPLIEALKELYTHTIQNTNKIQQLQLQNQQLQAQINQQSQDIEYLKQHLLLLQTK